jgi:hypothetical protein
MLKLFSRSRRSNQAYEFGMKKRPKYKSFLIAITVLSVAIPINAAYVNIHEPSALADLVDPMEIYACEGNPECFAFTIDTRLTDTLDTDPTHLSGGNNFFIIPVSGGVGGGSNSYDWIINWGDHNVDYWSGTSSPTDASVWHGYTVPGQYQIAIRPYGIATSGWLDAFSFAYGASVGANANANRCLFYSIDTPLTNMMRSHDVGHQFAQMFYGAKNALGIPTGLFDNITTNYDSDMSYMFYNTFMDFAYNSTTATIPDGLFDFIDTRSILDATDMFGSTFNHYAYNSTVATIPEGLFDIFDATQHPTDMQSMFGGTFAYYAYHSISATIPDDLFSYVNTSHAVSLDVLFSGTFSHYGYSSTTATIPPGLFDFIDTSGVIETESMFHGTFYNFAYNSTVGTIPVGLFDAVGTSSVWNMQDMFNYTFYNYAHMSTVGTVPADLFNSIDTNMASNASMTFDDTFTGYARRQAQFVVNGSAVSALAQTFVGPYSVKNGVSGAPDDYPIVALGDVVYPTYNDTVRTIPAPTGAYANYTWYYKDGTSCAVGSPTVDCGVQDNSTIVSFPNTTEWTPTTSTEKGNVTFYGVFNATLNLTLDSNQVQIGGSTGITPTSAGTFATATNTTTVKTNNLTGYKLQISTDQPSTNAHASDLSHQSLPGNYLVSTANTCSWNDSTKVFTDSNTAIATNTWGFTMSSTNLSAQRLCGVPPLTSPLTVKSTTAAQNTTGDITSFYYGAKLNLDQLAGQYRTEIVYTAIANP